MDPVFFSWMRDILEASVAIPSASSIVTALWPENPDSSVQVTEEGGALPDDPGKDPRFRKLVEAILFGRRFVPTYNLVLLGVLLIFTAWHWGEKMALRQRRRVVYKGKKKVDDEGEEGWSSSSSTLEGNVTPPNVHGKKIDPVSDETSPLLRTTTTSRKRLGIWKPYFVMKGWLQYQPKPIPVVNKTLPTNAVCIFVLAYIGLNVFYNFYNMPMELQFAFVFADRCGIIFCVNLPILYLLAAKNQPIKRLTGYSYESLNIFHRRVGELMCFEALLHFLGMFFVWYGLLRRLGFTLARFIFNRVVLLGLGAFICYQAIYLTSLGSFRQRMYEIFLALHVFLQVAALVFLWFHYKSSQPYVGISLAIFLIDRIVFRLWLKSTTHPATLTILEDDETLLLSANWDTAAPISALVPSNMKNGWEPNDHIFITVPALSRKQTLQTHPFTVFSAAPKTFYDDNDETENGTGKNHAWFTLLIRAQAPTGFTHTLLTHARTHPQTRIRLDGPYGSSHAMDILSASSTAIVIAGGSGIAVAYPLLYALLQPPTDTDTESAKTNDQSKRKVKLMWIVHSPSHHEWVPADKMQELQGWGLDVHIPPATREAGRPDVAATLLSWVDGRDRDFGHARTGVVVSGPDGLVRDVRNTCSALISAGRDVKVQVEKFGW